MIAWVRGQSPQPPTGHLVVGGVREAEEAWGGPCWNNPLLLPLCLDNEKSCCFPIISCRDQLVYTLYVKINNYVNIK